MTREEFWMAIYASTLNSPPDESRHRQAKDAADRAAAALPGEPDRAAEAKLASAWRGVAVAPDDLRLLDDRIARLREMGIDNVSRQSIVSRLIQKAFTKETE
jgi:hypothetical protein